MITYTWRFEKDPGATNSTFNSRCLFTMFNMVERYFDVKFEQKTSGSVSFRFVLTHQRKDPSWAEWTSGRTSYFGTWFRYQSPQQLTFAMLHGLGHQVGGLAHARPGSVMGPSIIDVYQNFTQADTAWFRFPLKRGVKKPWEEPNYWRPVRGWAQGAEGVPEYASGFEPCNVGHGGWGDWWNGMWAKREVVLVEE